MTGKKLLLFTLIQWLILALVKYCFFHYSIFAEAGTQELVYWIIVGVVATAIIRRFGVISFLEAIFIIILWTIFNFLFDLLWVSPFIGSNSLGTSQYLIGVVILALSGFLFHKIRHIHRRHKAHH